MKTRNIIALTACLAGAAWVLKASSREPLETIRRVDLERYTGRWFEIARYPNRFERKCDRDVTAEYSLKPNGRIRVVNSCVNRQGKMERSEGTAKIADRATNAKLKVAFFWPFYGNYWIIDLGPEDKPDYEYSVVGEPSREYLWILSRSPSLPDSLYEKLLRGIASHGYDPQKLVRTTQSGAAEN